MSASPTPGHSREESNLDHNRDPNPDPNLDPNPDPNLDPQPDPNLNGGTLLSRLMASYKALFILYC